MVEPIGYNTPWQKFENDIYNAVKKHFSSFRSDFRVEWNYNIRDVNPDVVVIGDCRCGAKPEDEPCEIPLLIFEACNMFDFSGNIWKKKEKQMRKYSRLCPSVLVTPGGYGNRAYCKSSKDEYRILSFQYLHNYLQCLRDNLTVEHEDEMCGSVISCNVEKANNYFELQLRSRVDRCPNCKSSAHPESLIYCSKYDEHYHPEFLDTEIIKYTPVYTHAECGGCSEREAGWDFEECPYSSIRYVYQCDKCGAIFDAGTFKIITNFEDDHLYMLSECDYSFYQELFEKRIEEFRKRLGI
jgi:hypothetical protein